MKYFRVLTCPSKTIEIILIVNHTQLLDQTVAADSCNDACYCVFKSVGTTQLKPEEESCPFDHKTESLRCWRC